MKLPDVRDVTCRILIKFQFLLARNIFGKGIGMILQINWKTTLLPCFFAHFPIRKGRAEWKSIFWINMHIFTLPWKKLHLDVWILWPPAHFKLAHLRGLQACLFEQYINHLKPSPSSKRSLNQNRSQGHLKRVLTGRLEKQRLKLDKNASRSRIKSKIKDLK